MEYDYERKRWAGFRPHSMRWSQMVLGRRACQARIAQTGELTVSAYKTSDGRVFFTDPVDRDKKAGQGVIYRINVRLKEGVRRI